MLRQHPRFFQSSQMIRDAIVVAACFWLAFSLRNWAAPFFGICGPPEPLATAELTMVLLLIWPWLGSAAGLYVSRRTRNRASELVDVTRALLLTFVSIVVLTYFGREVRYSRGTLVAWFVLAWLTLVLMRFTERHVLRRLRAQGRNLRHVLVVGEGPLAQRLCALIEGAPELGLRVVGLVADPILAESARHQRCQGDPPTLGRLDALPDLVARYGIDQVIIALPIDATARLPMVMEFLAKETVDVRVVPDFYQYMTLCGSVEDLYGLPLVTLQATPMVGWGRATKRILDLAVSSLACVLIAPALLLVALAIWIDDPGPIFYRQRRIGLDGQAFDMLKFRTMRRDAENLGARMTTAGDERCTRLGRLLRRYSIDEFPQLINVLRGEMSLVGPRPEQPSFSEVFKQSVPRYALRHKIKTGMTGWAQIHGLRGNTSISKRIDFDLYYIEHWSLMLDLRILLKTLCGGFLSPHAY